MYSTANWISLLSAILGCVLSMNILVTCGHWRGHFCCSCAPALHIKVQLQLQLPFQHKNTPWREAGNGRERSALEHHIPNSSAIAKHPHFPVSKSTWHSGSEWCQAVPSKQTPMGWGAFLCVNLHSVWQQRWGMKEGSKLCLLHSRSLKISPVNPNKSLGCSRDALPLHCSSRPGCRSVTHFTADCFWK